MQKIKVSLRLKIILIISVVIVASCEKSSDTKNVNKSIKISSEYSINSSCSDYNLEKLKFNKNLTAKEYYELNNKLKHLYSLNDDDIYKKYDLSKDIILYLNKIKEKNATISENSYFLELKKSSIIDFEASKNSIESESDFHSSIFQSLYNKIIDNDNEYFLLDSLNDKNKTIEIRSLKHENKYTKVIHESDFKSLTDFKNLIEIHSNNMINKIENIEHLNISHPSIGLSHAYLLKNIMDYFNDNSIPNDKEKSNSTLYKVIKAQVYANLVQLSSDVIDSGLKTAHIIEILRTNELDNLNFFRTFSKYSSKINIGLNFLNVLFDAYELNHAETNSELTRYKTQLGFDSASSGLIFGGMILGDSIAGTFLSGIGEIFGGLAIGFSSYAEVVGENIDIAINNANYFRYYEEDHYRILNSNNFVPFSENKELSLAHKYVKKDNIDNYKEQLDVVINEIDLTKQDFYKIKFGDHLTYPISRHDSDSIYYHPFAPPPELITSSTEYVKFREALEIPEEKEFKLNNINKIILPNQTQKFIKYRHGFYAPWITYRNDAELNAVRKIQRNSKFIFDYSVMRGAGDMAISELKFESKNTDIKIKLNSKNSGIHFISPQIHDSSENKINYYFEVDKSEKLSSNKFNLHLNNSSKYYINSHSNDIWHFHIEDRFLDSNFDKSYKNLNIKHSGNKDKDFTILFSDNKPRKIYIHDKLGVTYLIFNKEHIKAIPVSIDLNYENFKDKNELEFAVDELREKFRDKIKYIKILNYLNNKNNTKETIFYDLSNYEYIYSNLNSSDLIIIDTINSIPIFFDKSNKSLHYSSVVAKNVTDIRYNSNKYFITSTENNENLVYEINGEDMKIVETTNLKFKKELLGKLVRIIDRNDNCIIR